MRLRVGWKKRTKTGVFGWCAVAMKKVSDSMRPSTEEPGRAICQDRRGPETDLNLCGNGLASAARGWANTRQAGAFTMTFLHQSLPAGPTANCVEPGEKGLAVAGIPVDDVAAIAPRHDVIGGPLLTNPNLAGHERKDNGARHLSEIIA